VEPGGFSSSSKSGTDDAKARGTSKLRRLYNCTLKFLTLNLEL
jgi:hypothetical protein